MAQLEFKNEIHIYDNTRLYYYIERFVHISSEYFLFSWRAQLISLYNMYNRYMIYINVCRYISHTPIK